MKKYEVAFDRKVRSDVLTKIAMCASKTELQAQLRELINSAEPATIAVASTIAIREGEVPLAALGCVRALCAGLGESDSFLNAVSHMTHDVFGALGYSRTAADLWLADAFESFGGDQCEKLSERLQELQGENGKAEATTREEEAVFAARDDAIARLLAVTARSAPGAVTGTPRQSWPAFSLFWAATLGSALFAWVFRDSLPTPTTGLASRTFWLAALYMWMPALVTSWLVCFYNAKKTKVFDSISPRHFGSDEGLVAGQHESFSVDFFYHIFQFVWFPIVGYLFLMELDFGALEALENGASQSGASANTNLIQSLDWIHRPAIEALQSALDGHLLNALVNEQVGILFGLFAGGLTLFVQTNVQRTRIQRRVDFYWWDIRVGHPSWIIRWFMVAVDMMFGAIMLQKVVVLNAFVIGGFVIASWYLHRDLPQYRTSDAILSMLYVAIIIGIIAIPVWRLEFVLSESMLEQKATIIASLLPGQGESLTEATVGSINAVRSWHASMFELNALNSPIFLLGLQAIAFAVQTVRRQQNRYAASASVRT